MIFVNISKPNLKTREIAFYEGFRRFFEARVGPFQKPSGRVNNHIPLK